jgi:hypothetical protein
MTSITLTFIDSAYPLDHVVPGAQGVAGYIGGDTPHVWSRADWESQPYQYRLPIFVRSNPVVSDIPGDITDALSQLRTINAPHGTIIALDSETAIDPSYTIPFVVAINAGGYRVMDYGSQQDVFQSKNPDGYYWGADWTGQPHLVAGDVGTQYVSFISYDESEISKRLPLWNLAPATLPTTQMDPPPGQWLNPANWTWQEVMIIGRGLNNELFSFAFDARTGVWTGVPRSLINPDL